MERNRKVAAINSIYDRKIKYFDYLEDGQRIRNGGFARLELRGGICRINIQISGLYTTINGTYKVEAVCAEGREVLCDILLTGGRGSKDLQLPGENLCVGMAYGDLEELEIIISHTRLLRCRILGGKKKDEQQKEVLLKEPENKEARNVGASGEQKEQKEIAVASEESYIDELIVDGEAQKNSDVEGQMPLLGDKWRQLWEIYPHRTPFGDGREYLSIGPGDFVIMPERYYKLVNNSFLLHGFYNYKHLIMTRMQVPGGVRYYIGVPGNFYEREKQVALMFGFESFECREEPAQIGEFGYYMIPVEL